MPSTAEPGGSEFATAHTAFRSLGTSSSHSCEDMGFVDPPEMPAEPDYDGDFDGDFDYDCDHEDGAFSFPSPPGAAGV